TRTWAASTSPSTFRHSTPGTCCSHGTRNRAAHGTRNRAAYVNTQVSVLVLQHNTTTTTIRDRRTNLQLELEARNPSGAEQVVDLLAQLLLRQWGEVGEGLVLLQT
ncbi:unnamed protein product, partial [Linum tenue]